MCINHVNVAECRPVKYSTATKFKTRQQARKNTHLLNYTGATGTDTANNKRGIRQTDSKG